MGRNLTIAANPDVNSKFVRWVGADVPPGQANSSYLYLSEISKNMEFTPVFAKDLASVTVNIDGPPASAWRIIGITGWMNGGVTVADIVPGTYTIEFQYVKGWVEPASLSIELSNGSKVTREGTYENIQEEYPPRIHYFTSTVEYISAGSEIRLEWFIQGGKAKSITNVGEVTGNVNYIDVRVDETTEFELTASNDNGISKAKTTIIVIEKPDIKFFVSSHNNENPLHAGEKAELSWFIKGADEVEIVGVEDEIPAGQVTSGTHIVSPETTTTYKLVAKNSFSRSEAVVSVPVTELPEIETFKSSHNVLPKGTTAKLKWKVKGVNFVTISPDIGEVKSSGSLKVKPEKDTTFTLEAENVAGKVSNELEMEVIDENFDLSVEILSIKQPVVVGKTSEVRVKVSNGGNTRADKVVVKLLDGKNPLKYFTINSIRAESSKIVKLNIVPTKAPKLILNAVVDPDNLIREKVEKNNRDSVAVVSEKVKGIDLLPRNIRIEEAEGMPEGTFVISYVITNVGSEDSSGFQCDVSVNTGLKGKFQFIFADEADELKPGKTTRFEREVFIEEAPAKLKVQVEVDSLKAIHESNENNNIVIQKR